MTCLLVPVTMKTSCQRLQIHSRFPQPVQSFATQQDFRTVRCPPSKYWRTCWGRNMIFAQPVKHLCFPLSSLFFVLTVDLFTERPFPSHTHAPPRLIPHCSFNKAPLKVWRMISERDSYTKYKKYIYYYYDSQVSKSHWLYWISSIFSLYHVPVT